MSDRKKKQDKRPISPAEETAQRLERLRRGLPAEPEPPTDVTNEVVGLFRWARGR